MPQIQIEVAALQDCVQCFQVTATACARRVGQPDKTPFSVFQVHDARLQVTIAAARAPHTQPLASPSQ